MIIFLTDSFPLCLIYLKACFRVCGKFNIHLLIFACVSAAVPDRGDPRGQEEKSDPKVIWAVFQTSQPNSEAILVVASPRVRLCPLAIFGLRNLSLSKGGKWWLRDFLFGSSSSVCCRAVLPQNLSEEPLAAESRTKLAIFFPAIDFCRWKEKIRTSFIFHHLLGKIVLFPCFKI